MTEDAMKVLELMGVPVYKAVSEAEAECVNLLKRRLCDVVGSDDMDCLTFGCEYLIKGIRQQKDPVIEISLQSVLKELELSMDEFIDFCILCGCDYLPTVQGIGPGTALKLIKEF
jgi:flap endonuclease-1